MLKYRLRTTARLVVNLDKKLLKENLLGRFSPQEAVSVSAPFLSFEPGLFF